MTHVLLEWSRATSMKPETRIPLQDYTSLLAAVAASARVFDRDEEPLAHLVEGGE